MIGQKRYRKITKARNMKTNLFLGLWMDNSGNGTFGVLEKTSRTKSKIILEIIRDITSNNYIEPEKLKESELTLINYNELIIPEVIEYKIVCMVLFNP